MRIDDIKQLLVCLCLLLVVFLSGCGSAKANLTLKDDGSIDYQYEVSMPDGDEKTLDNPDVNPLILHELTAQQEGYEVKRFKEKGFWGYRATKHFPTVTALKQSVFFNQYIKNKEEDFFSYNDLFLFKSIGINIIYDLNATLYPVTTEPDGFVKHNLEEVKMTFTLTLPKLAVTNGKATNTPNTYEWAISPTTPTTIKAQLYSTHWSVTLLLVGFMGFLFWLLWRRKKL